MKRLNRMLFDALPSNRLPERALQFGTGGFLRGFIGHFINTANEQNLFNGRVVAVGSTGSGRDRVFNEQDGLFTLWMRGIEGGEPVSELQLSSAYSRALSATGQWPDVLECARSPELELVFSNTTEAGIALDEADAPDESPPRSFPAKLTRFLWERARHFDFDAARGLAVVPCELIEDNGAKLKQLVLTLADRWQLDPRFARWINDAVPFCNTLVDRIVPGEPAPESQAEAWRELGYQDELLTVVEPYRLFAIEANAQVAARLRFAAADPAVVISDDIAPYRLRKVRLLNGAHTIMVPVALLAGCETVSEALDDPRVGAFVRHVLLQELVPSVAADGAEAFARHVLERFANPFIRHELVDITLQQTMKMRVRVIPSILDYTRTFGSGPSSVAFGFAAWLLYMRDARGARADAHAERVRAHWQNRVDARAVVRAVAGDEELWGVNLSTIPGFADAVADALDAIQHDGVSAALDAHLAAANATV